MLAGTQDAAVNAMLTKTPEKGVIGRIDYGM
jgi:hypothetical protein